MVVCRNILDQYDCDRLTHDFKQKIVYSSDITIKHQLLSFLIHQHRINGKLYKLFDIRSHRTNQSLQKVWCINKDKEGNLTTRCQRKSQRI